MQSISNYLETQRNTQGVEDDIDAILQKYIKFNYKYRKSEKQKYICKTIGTTGNYFVTTR